MAVEIVMDALGEGVDDEVVKAMEMTVTTDTGVETNMMTALIECISIYVVSKNRWDADELEPVQDPAHLSAAIVTLTGTMLPISTSSVKEVVVMVSDLCRDDDSVVEFLDSVGST